MTTPFWNRGTTWLRSLPMMPVIAASAGPVTAAAPAPNARNGPPGAAASAAPGAARTPAGTPTAPCSA